MVNNELLSTSSNKPSLKHRVLKVAGLLVLVSANTLLGASLSNVIQKSPLRIGDDSSDGSASQEGLLHIQYEDVVGFLHSQKWTLVENKLCPAGVPNVDMGPTLFKLARKELGITPATHLKAKASREKVQGTVRPKQELTYRFFNGEFQNATVFENWANGESFAFIPIWKGANRAFRIYIESTFSKASIAGEVKDIRFGDYLGGNNGAAPCTVTAIRDPISHFLSAYNEVEYRRDNLDGGKYRPSYLDLPHETGRQRATRFTQFLADILMEDSAALKGSVIQHAFSMSRILIAIHQYGGSLTAYLPTLRNMGKEFPKFLKKECPSAIPNGITMEEMDPGKGQHQSSGDPEGFYKAAKDIWASGGTVARALCVLHAMDYSCWKALSGDIPLICREVFSSDDFVQRILKV